MPNMTYFTGRIAFVSDDGRSAIVLLDEKKAGREFAVISDVSKGRVHLMNGRGRLRTDIAVKGEAEVPRSERQALRVLTVSQSEAMTAAE